MRGFVEPPPDRHVAHAAAFGLVLRHPGKSASLTLGKGRKRAAAKGFALSGIAGLFAPELLSGVAGLLAIAMFGGILIFRIWLYLAGTPSGAVRTGAADTADWPVYTLLIALKDEAETASQLAAAIRALDYPD